MIKMVALVYLEHILPVGGGGGSVLGALWPRGVSSYPCRRGGFRPRGVVSRGVMSGHLLFQLFLAFHHFLCSVKDTFSMRRHIHISGSIKVKISSNRFSWKLVLGMKSFPKVSVTMTDFSLSIMHEVCSTRADRSRERAVSPSPTFVHSRGFV